MRRFLLLVPLAVVGACDSCEGNGPIDLADASGANDAAGLDGGSDAGRGDAGFGVDANGLPDVSGLDVGIPSDAGMQACPNAPAGSDGEQVAALTAVNDARARAGIPCATMVATINQAASAHCAYYAANKTMSACFTMGNAHSEVASCAGFTGAAFFNRMTAAGYGGSSRFEDMAYGNDGAGAVAQWIDSVWHRTPVLSPWIRDLGYGHAAGCDTMDFGVGTATSATFVATYPYANQTAVPTSFDGRFEGPMPPAPPGGWPSGYPVTIFIRGIPTANMAGMTHQIRVDGTGTNLAHQFLTPASQSLLTDEYVLYTDSPLAAATTYRVTVSGMRTAGPVTVDFVFTTR